MVFESPLWLFALALLPALAGLEAFCVRRDRVRLSRLVARALWPRVVRRPAEAWRFARLALLLLGAAGIVLALARPQWGIVRERVEREGADVVLALDTSGSMATEDVAPSRFFLARQALASLVERLHGERFGLVAFEGEAHGLVPLTLDADAVGLFLDALEPGFLPTPGSSLAAAISRGLELFADPDRPHKVLVLVSDGEDLEGGIDAAVRRAREAGVVIHAVGVGTEAGQPVPHYDSSGQRVGFKRDASGQVVVSRLDMPALEAIARGTGGRAFRLTPADPGLSGLASAIQALEQKALAAEWSYRRRERYQAPLGAGLAALTLALLLPPPRRHSRSARLATAASLILLLPASLPAQSSDAPSPPPPDAATEAAHPRSGTLADELLLRPRRLTEKGRRDYGRGNHPEALSAFEGAHGARPADPRTRFNLADALYKNGRFDEAAEAFRVLGDDERSELAAPARHNLGNSLFQKQDYAGAVRAYRDALRLEPESLDTRRNLELALLALREQERRGQQQEPDAGQASDPQQPPRGDDRRPPDPRQQEDARFRREAGMPRERAMQLLDALQQNEKEEQRKLRERERRERKGDKDW